MKKSFTIIIGLFLLFVAAPSQANWTGAGDGTSWSDVDNWSEGFVPLTTTDPNGATIDVIDPNTPLTVNLDAATADTFYDGTNDNFLSTRATGADGILNVNANWGEGYTNSGMIPGQYTTGTVNYNHIGGMLTLTENMYMGRSSEAGSVVNVNVTGGSLIVNQPWIGGRTDALGDITLHVEGADFTVPTDSGVPGNPAELTSGAPLASTTTLFEIAGSANVFVNDWRMGGLGSGQGTDMLEITGSNATITVDLNFYTCQQGSYLGDCIVKFIADAGGVSTITAYDDASTYRIAVATDLIVDITNYTGFDDLVLVDFAPGKLNGTYVPGDITIISSGRTADVIQDNVTGDIYLTNFNVPGNVLPEVEAGADKETYLDNGGSAVLALSDATVSDSDAGPGALTQEWSVQSGPGVVTFSPDEFAVNPNAIFTVDGTYVLKLAANDTAGLSYDTVQVIVDADGCEYAKAQPGFELLAGDIDEDCFVDLLDLAILAAQWLQSN